MTQGKETVYRDTNSVLGYAEKKVETRKDQSEWPTMDAIIFSEPMDVTPLGFKKTSKSQPLKLRELKVVELEPVKELRGHIKHPILGTNK